MPQVIISLPNAIFPFFAHLLNAQVHEEDVNHLQARDTRSPRRPYSRQSQHRRQSQSQTTPRHRSTRHATLRHRRTQRVGQETGTHDIYSHIQNENIVQQTELTYLPDPRKNSSEGISIEEGSSSVPAQQIPPLSLETVKERSEGETEGEAGTPEDGGTNVGDAVEETESINEETQDDDTSTYGEDSDSEQFRVSSPHDDPHESEHDGDEETGRERARRRRRRSGRTGERSTGERNAGELTEPERDGTEVGHNPNAAAQGTGGVHNNAAQEGEAEREIGGSDGRFVGSGWWFLALLLLVQLYQSGGFLFLLMLALYVGFNSSAMLTYRSRSWKYRLAFLSATTIVLLGTIFFIYWKFREEKLWMYLVFIPSTFQYSVTGALWTVWVNEFIVVFLTIVGKHYLIIMCASFRVFGQSTKKKILALMEQASKLYRCTIPIPVWIFYLYHAFGEEGDLVKLRGLVFSGIYIYFVAVNVKFLGAELAKIIEHKTPEELCHRATTEDINKYTEDCAICRDDLSSRSPLTLPCSHVFCTECIYQWFDKHPSCPTCRSKIGTEDMFEESSGNTNIHLQENGIGLSVSFDDL